MASKDERNGKPQPTSQQSISCRNVNGVSIGLNIITHQPLVCQEFIVTSPKFNFCRWLAWTLVLQVLGYVLQLHLQDKRLLTGLLVFLIVALLLKSNFKIQKESLLVTKAVGIQLTTTFASGRRKSMFYDMANVNSIVINEAVTMHRVIFYLALLFGQAAADGQQLVPLFTHSWPSLSCLTCIYRQVSLLLPVQSQSPGVHLKTS